MDPDQTEEDHADLNDDAVPARGYATLPVVGLGGSASSLPALRSFFRALPADPGAAFLIALHAHPGREVALLELLRADTRMPVQELDGPRPAEPNHVYVLPPGKVLHAENGSFEVLDARPNPGRHVTVDLFFRTLADTPRAACGGRRAVGRRWRRRDRHQAHQGTGRPDDRAGSERGRPAQHAALGDRDRDGRLGAAGERDAGRACSSTSASSASCGCRPRKDRSRPSCRCPPTNRPRSLCARCCAFLRTRTGRDFSYYKRATILRRIARRMQVNGVDELTAYLACPAHVGRARPVRCCRTC